MNRHERAKAEALFQCRIHAEGDRHFVRGMVLLARRDPETVLTPRQKWTLDCLVYRYRRQLYSHPEVNVPAREPRLDDYQPTPRRRRQMDLFSVRSS